METHFYLVRHGETDWNTQRRFQGHADIPLNKVGIWQAEKLADWLQDTSFTAVYSSDLSRAVQTAEIVARGHGLPVIERKELRERCMGEWEGMTLEEVDTLHPGWRERIGEALWCDRFGIESSSKMVQRLIHLLEKLAKKHAGNRILIVSHGGLINMALTELSQGQLKKMRVKNTSVTHAIHSAGQGWQVIRAGMAEHLPIC